MGLRDLVVGLWNYVIGSDDSKDRVDISATLHDHSKPPQKEIDIRRTRIENLRRKHKYEVYPTRDDLQEVYTTLRERIGSRETESRLFGIMNGISELNEATGKKAPDTIDEAVHDFEMLLKDTNAQSEGQREQYQKWHNDLMRLKIYNTVEKLLGDKFFDEIVSASENLPLLDAEYEAAKKEVSRLNSAVVELQDRQAQVSGNFERSQEERELKLEILADELKDIDKRLDVAKAIEETSKSNLRRAQNYVEEATDDSFCWGIHDLVNPVAGDSSSRRITRQEVFADLMIRKVQYVLPPSGNMVNSKSRAQIFETFAQVARDKALYTSAARFEKEVASEWSQQYEIVKQKTACTKHSYFSFLVADDEFNRLYNSLITDILAEERRKREAEQQSSERHRDPKLDSGIRLNRKSLLEKLGKKLSQIRGEFTNGFSKFHPVASNLQHLIQGMHDIYRVSNYDIALETELTVELLKFNNAYDKERPNEIPDWNQTYREIHGTENPLKPKS